MPLVPPEEFKATLEEWAELAPWQENPQKPRKRRVKATAFFSTFEGLEVRIALVHAPDYTTKNRVVINSSRDVYRLLLPRLRDEPVESFLVLCLNARSKVDAVHVVARGHASAVEVLPQHVLQAPLLTNSQRIILAHNHPSSDATPSGEDVRMTRRIVGAAELMGIKVLDHVVCGLDTFASMADRNMMPEAPQTFRQMLNLLQGEAG